MKGPVHGNPRQPPPPRQVRAARGRPAPTSASRRLRRPSWPAPPPRGPPAGGPGAGRGGAEGRPRPTWGLSGRPAAQGEDCWRRRPSRTRPVGAAVSAAPGWRSRLQGAGRERGGWGSAPGRRDLPGQPARRPRRGTRARGPACGRSAACCSGLGGDSGCAASAARGAHLREAPPSAGRRRTGCLRMGDSCSLPGRSRAGGVVTGLLKVPLVRARAPRTQGAVPRGRLVARLICIPAQFWDRLSRGRLLCRFSCSWNLVECGL